MKKRFACLSIILCACLALSGCSPNMTAYTTFAYFNTQTRWAYVSHGTHTDAETWESVVSLASDIEKSVSLSVEESALSRFNRAAAGETIEIDQTAYEILSIAREAYTLTEGAYNPAVGLYIDLWGFSPRCTAVSYAPSRAYDRQDYTKELPDEAYIEAFRPLTDFSAVALFGKEGRYYLTKPDVAVEVAGVSYTMQLNLGGIAKGYCTDKAKIAVEGRGYRDGYLAFGTSSLCVLENPFSDAVGDKAWSVGVNAPREELGAQYMNVFAKNTSVSSSGDSELYYEIGGTRYCHIIDPDTGYPVNVLSGGEGIIGVTLVGVSGALGDALATALHVMGKERAIAFARETLTDCGVSFVYTDVQGAYTLYTNLNEDAYEPVCAALTAVKF